MAVAQANEMLTERKPPVHGIHWMAFLMVVLGCAIVGATLWNTYEIRQLKANTAVADQAANGLFLSPAGWGIGRLAPDVPLRAADGSITSLRSVAERYGVVYVGADTCPLCAYQYPDLNHVSDALKQAGSSFAMVVTVRNTGLAEFVQANAFHFPVFEVDQAGLDRMNLANSPTVLILRNGILGDAFQAATVDRLADRATVAVKER